MKRFHAFGSHGEGRQRFEGCGLGRLRNETGRVWLHVDKKNKDGHGPSTVSDAHNTAALFLEVEAISRIKPVHLSVYLSFSEKNNNIIIIIITTPLPETASCAVESITLLESLREQELTSETGERIGAESLTEFVGIRTPSKEKSWIESSMVVGRSKVSQRNSSMSSSTTVAEDMARELRY